MSDSSSQQHELVRPGLRKEFRSIDHDIWLWTVGKTLTKRQIQDYAKEAFEKGGISQFKASDGWYRRWLVRWGKNKNGLEQDSKTKKTDVPAVRLNNLSPEVIAEVHPSTSQKSNLFKSKRARSSNDCAKPRGKCSTPSQKSEDSSVERTNPESQTQINNSQDLTETSGLSDPVTKEPVAVVPKRKIERYLPQFKAKVVSYALKYSIKDAVYTYKVHKSTIADWIRDERKCAENVDGALEIEFRPDRDFVEWLQRERKSGRLITKDLLINKFKELTTYVNRDLATKKAMWFYKYVDRFADENPNTKTHIMYPTSFKRELALLCGKWSKKTIGAIFNVDRKRISNWAEHYLNDNYTKPERKVDCYLTDDKVDTDVWEWYSQQFPKPKPKLVRERAVLMYRQAGYTGISCSSGWYYRWRKRYMLPSSSTEKKDFDEQLICWILAEFDDNKSITHAQLISQATAFRGDGFKNFPSGSIKLPSPLECKAVKFQEDLLLAIERNSVELDCIVAFDEIPLNFSTSGNQQPKYLLRKSGFDNCHASLILVCTASGVLCPCTLIVKEQDEASYEDYNACVNLFYQQQGLADSALLVEWFSTLLQGCEKPCIFICDSYTPHKDLQEIYSAALDDRECKLLLIPGGCSSRLLPTSFGISEEFKSAILCHWEKSLQETCWNSGSGVKLPSSYDIKSWVSQAHKKCSDEQMDAIINGFSKILTKA